METITSIEMFNEKKAEGKSIFVFSADWCPDCVVIKPILPEIEERFNEYSFYYVDRDELIELCQQEDIFGIPSFVAYEEGKEIDRYVNKERKTKEQIENFIQGL
jgi:thiol-disulfide isomerase/thioredoxin